MAVPVNEKSSADEKEVLTFRRWTSGLRGDERWTITPQKSKFTQKHWDKCAEDPLVPSCVTFD